MVSQFALGQLALFLSISCYVLHHITALMFCAGLCGAHDWQGDEARRGPKRAQHISVALYDVFEIPTETKLRVFLMFTKMGRNQTIGLELNQDIVSESLHWVRCALALLGWGFRRRLRSISIFYQIINS
jgi:hypothetical protein